MTGWVPSASLGTPCGLGEAQTLDEQHPHGHPSAVHDAGEGRDRHDAAPAYRKRVIRVEKDVEYREAAGDKAYDVQQRNSRYRHFVRSPSFQVHAPDNSTTCFVSEAVGRRETRKQFP